MTTIATTLLSQGIPNVIGMKYPVAGNYATDLARIFYHKLAVGKDVETSLALGRQSISLNYPMSQWTIPVLYSGTKGTDIIDWEAAISSLTATLNVANATFVTIEPFALLIITYTKTT